MQVKKIEFQAVRLFTADLNGHIIEVRQEDSPEYGPYEKEGQNRLFLPIFLQYHRGIESLTAVLEEREELREKLRNSEKLAQERYEKLSEYWCRDAEKKNKKWWQFWRKS